MFSIQSLLIFMFSGALAGVLLFFFRRTKGIKQIHNEKLQTINQLIILHKNQLNYREKGLVNYNFLKYNLGESLKVQPEIKLI